VEPTPKLQDLFGDAPYRMLIKEIEGFAIFHIDPTGHIVSWNAGAERVFGYREAEVTGQPFALIFTPEDRRDGAPEQELKRAASVGSTNDVRWHLRQDNTRFYANGVTTALRDEAGVLRGFAKVARDDTARKLAEEALQESEERYRIVAETASDAIITIDEESTILYVNSAAEKIFGHPTREMLGQHLTILMPELLRHVHRAGISRYIETGQRHIGWEAIELPGLHQDGREVPLEVSFGEFLRDGQHLFTGIIRDITKRKLTEKALRESEERWRFMAESMPQKIFTATAKGDVNYFNRQWIEFTGLAFEQIIDWGWTQFIHPDDVEENVRRWQHSVDTGTPFQIEHRFRRADGEYRWHLSRAHAMRDPAGDVLMWIGSNTDIDDMKRAEMERTRLLEREQAARAEAVAANNLKDEFLATLSHELRTPLTAIIGWSNMLLAGGMKEADAARALETIHRNARAQNQLIDDLLDVSRIVTGKLRLDVQPVELSVVIIAAVEVMRPSAEAKSIRLQMVLDPSVCLVSGDANRLQQVIWNLISNAIKFTPKGGRVQVRLERVNSHVEITIADTGAGINPEFLPHVFDRFRQADSAITRTHGGLGLGLSIVRQLVELHGGTVRAESEGEGNGATFIVSLPFIATRRDSPLMERVHPATNCGNMSFDCPPQLIGLRVLIVDDEDDTRDLLRAVMERCGCEATSVGSVAEALATLQQTNPDVLISDIGMPEEDGYSFIRKVRALPAERGGNTPAIALTAYARSEDRIRALMAGFQMHVPKPIEPIELAAVVASLSRRNGHR